MTKLRVHVVTLALGLLCAFCNRTVGGGLAHIATPNPDGSPCNNDVQCASDSCSSGTCATPSNGTIEIDAICSGGGSCVPDATCEDDICVETAAACAPLLATCASSSDCCSGACDTSQSETGGCPSCCFDAGSCGASSICVDCLPKGTCTGGAGVCAAEGGSCLEGTDCCAGLCDFRDSTNIHGVCSTTCVEGGDRCKGGDCCDGYCDFNVAQCAACSGSTVNTQQGQPCASSADCCGITCVGASPGIQGTCRCGEGTEAPCE